MLTTIRTVLALAAVSSPVAIYAQSAEYDLAIERKPLKVAITELSQQTGLKVVLIGTLAEREHMLVGPLKGRYTIATALKEISEGAGLPFDGTNGTTIAVFDTRKSNAASQTQPHPPLMKMEGTAYAQALPAASPAPAREARRIDQDDVEEVIVTAQKRAERLQDVPISISVLGGEILDSTSGDGVTGALNRVPGVATTVGVQGGGTQVAIRGVTASGALFQGSSPVAYYLDSVPFGFVKTAIAPDANAYDLERVEVLRGPQGTLYGASAQNGVVRVLTNNANLDEFDFKARTSASGTQDGGENYRGDAAVNVPLVPGKLAIRAVAGYEDSSGWIDRPDGEDVNDAMLRSYRVKVNAQPTEALSIGASAWLSRADYGAPSTGNDDHFNVATLDESIEIDYSAYGLKIAYELPAVTITSSTSYLEYESGGDLDLISLLGAHIPIFTGLESEVFAQEVFLNSTAEGAWRWSAGGIYRDAEDRLLQPLVLTDHSDLSESFAVFGEVTRMFLDNKLELTVGLRYFEDDVTGRENIPSSGDPAQPLFRSNETFDAVSPRVVLTWHPSADLTVYTSYSEGFRSGFDQYANIKRAAPDFKPVDADTLTNYEIGAKATALGGRLRFDTAVYYIDWQDVQQAITVEFNGVPFTANVNGASASGLGFEFSAATRFIDPLEISANFSWNDLTMDEALLSIGNAALFNKGDRLNASAEYTAGLAADYFFPVGESGYEVHLAAAANYSSKQSLRSIVGGVSQASIGDDMLIGRTSLTVDSPDHWSAMLFVDNVNNERGAPQRQAVSFRDWDLRVRPRTVGLQLEYKF